MDFIRLALEHIFCKYPYDRLVCNFYNNKIFDLHDPIDKNVFIRNINAKNPIYSDDTLELLYNIYKSEWLLYPTLNKPLDCIENRQKNIFHTLLHFTNKILRIKEGKAVVRFEQLLRWRELSYLVGEDLLICSFLAHQDCKTFIHRTDFSWSTICINDDLDLRHLLNKKIAELHFHLKGSSDNFEISWICLMNHITKRSKEFKELDKNVMSNNTTIERDLLYSSFYKLCIDAAYLRLKIFRFIEQNSNNIFFNAFAISTFIEETENLQYEINIERNNCHSLIENYCYDYTVKLENNNTDILDVFSGERRLLYASFKYIYEGSDPDGHFTFLVFRYVLAKAHLRMELIQVNEQKGFSNFSKYENRKEMFVERYVKYKLLVPRIAIHESVNKHGVNYIEARVTPKNSVIDMRSLIVKLNAEIDKSVQTKDNKKLFYICHFIKQKDFFNKDSIGVVERHHKLRINIKKQVQAIMRLRHESPLIAANILAIDAANSELYCRPEVFAQAYRYAQSFANFTLYSPLNYMTKLSDLKYTFHAGEDFFDIADGLRAIDEAIHFLNLQRGDRLGHCLALGIDPVKYYIQRNKQAIIPKMLFLDNVVWLKYKLRYFNIDTPPSIDDFIETIYERLYLEIYGGKIPTIRSYCHSMNLRGDDPYYYLDYQTIEKVKIPFGWDSVCFDMTLQVRESRSDVVARELYFRYHFDKNVRIKGDEVINFTLSNDYINVIKMLQDKMIHELTNRHIIVECCPTSNLKIGSFNRYDEHPMYRFFDIALTKPSNNQLQVTINTDDQGIFATSLDNEYALTVLSLLKKKNDDGNFCYSRHQVLKWLNEVYENSNKYKFMTE